MSLNLKEIEEAWQKAGPVPGCDPALLRKDVCGAWLQRDQYGKRDSDFGWEIEDLPSHRPLQWKNNDTRQDGKLSCPVTASGRENISRASYD